MKPKVHSPNVTQPSGVVKVKLLSSTGLNAPWALSTLEYLLSGSPIELNCVLVEDINLFRFATLPFAGVVSQLTGVETPLGEQQLSRVFKQCATEIENSINELSHRLKIKPSFTIIRGHIETELHQQNNGADFVIINHKQSGQPFFKNTEAVLNTLLSGVKKLGIIKIPLLSATSMPPKIAVVCTSADTTDYVVTAAEIAEKCGGELIVLGLMNQRERTVLNIDSAITGYHLCVKLNYYWFESIEPTQWAVICNRLQSTLLVLPSSLLDPTSLNPLLASLDSSLLIVK